VPAEDLVFPAAHGGGEPAEFDDVGLGAVGVEPLEPSTRSWLGPAGVQLPQQFLGQVGGADLALGIAQREGGVDASPPSVGEPFMSDEQVSADAIQRVALAASVTGGVLLDATSDVVEGGVGKAQGVEVVDHQIGVWEPIGQTPRVAGVGVERHRGDAAQSRRWSRGQPPTNPVRGAAFDDVEEPVTVQVDEPGHQQRRMLGTGGQERGLVHTESRRGAQTG
jgi:hypothetical protein